MKHPASRGWVRGGVRDTAPRHQPGSPTVLEGLWSQASCCQDWRERCGLRPTGRGVPAGLVQGQSRDT